MHVGKGYSVHDDKEAMEFAWVWFNNKDYGAAERTINIALGINPKNIDAYNLLGIIALKNSDPRKSVEYLEKANYLVKENNAPYSEYILNNLGFAYYSNQEYRKALQVFEASFEIKKNWVSSFGTAMALYNLGDKEGAKPKIEYCKNETDFESKAKEILEYFNIATEENLIKFLGLKENKRE
ncbi:MAG: tetratricopeptide repeat protein [Candidatus Omnitrophica bacterium]|nr:tetratricopeptide repeat protein [Candidatus Omnitrophota bacterium]